MQIFVSYNHRDTSWAEWIAWQLEKLGHIVTIQSWDFLPGTNFVLKMQEAIEHSDRTVLVLSPDFLQSVFAAPEWAAAFAADPTSAKRKLLPVRVRECRPTGLLAQIIYVDLVGLDQTAAANRLALSVDAERLKPLTPPNFPELDRATNSGLGAALRIAAAEKLASLNGTQAAAAFKEIAASSSLDTATRIAAADKLASLNSTQAAAAFKEIATEKRP